VAGPNVSATHRERAEKIRSARVLLGEIRDLTSEMPRLSDRWDKLLTIQEYLCDVVEGLVKESGST
jgi:hypothetical protein